LTNSLSRKSQSKLDNSFSDEGEDTEDVGDIPQPIFNNQPKFRQSVSAEVYGKFNQI
jgi:hypothetical protein